MFEHVVSRMIHDDANEEREAGSETFGVDVEALGLGVRHGLHAGVDRLGEQGQRHKEQREERAQAEELLRTDRLAAATQPHTASSSPPSQPQHHQPVFPFSD